MAHDGTGAGWDEAAPASTDQRKDGYKEIYDLRKGVRIRVEKEHETPDVSSAGGEHKEGSAKAYYDIATTFPTTRPDGSTALGTDDKGRLAVIDGELFVWEGSAWCTTSSSHEGNYAMTGSYGLWINVGMPFRALAIYHTNGHNGMALLNTLADEEVALNFIDATGGIDTVTINVEQASDPFRFQMKCTISGSFRWRILL